MEGFQSDDQSDYVKKLALWLKTAMKGSTTLTRWIIRPIEILETLLSQLITKFFER